MVAGLAGEIMKDVTQEDLEKRILLASKKPGREKTEVKVGNCTIGGKKVAVIAGPCAVESREQIFDIAKNVKDAGAVMLRGGVYKPLTFPDMWESPGEEGLKWLYNAGKEYGLPVVTEVMDPRLVGLVAKYADALQIGARNMQNFPLLKEVAMTGKPVLLKRHPGMSLRDLLGSAEWILKYGGHYNVALCERGISAPHTHNPNSRFLPDIAAIPYIKRFTHLPVVFDPSHSTFDREMVKSMALAAVAAGADGIIVDVHPVPEKAAVDNLQALDYEAFELLMADLKYTAKAAWREV